jgi:hypothetical protein
MVILAPPPRDLQFMYPETKGRSIEEMEEVFNSGHEFSAWKLKADLGKKTLREVEQGRGPVRRPLPLSSCALWR